MPRVAFKMQLFPGNVDEYRRRHDEIWPELVELLQSSGIHNYSIFLDESTNTLFGVQEVDDLSVTGKLPENPVMQKWWAYMADLMETNPDQSPVQVALPEVFYLK
ncbi:L-rhamnose mutarotase [Siphonobacter sp. BAB-5385]|uniref:L-rhamnose mutarotase n=1 Tax=Siphonobacter curvatus TaxID=2094562 RepID=A0A2S7IM15_9BACT|nr:MULTISPECIES: L-rhamnose mutarotase [Siphonobacter]OZI07800.1 L-rhamnose mutarotase [Siphonobacter sp. BAB-5385]PMD94538.1 L-rhamnose mutarotase [Siphonobacter sp. BAB-5405]PQA58725.1 L-rhamnose mutarotase [Siphonobacter curvatus]